jgi:hypothetical protein
LEAHVYALRGTHAFGDCEGLFGLLDVDAHRLFAIDMLAGGDGGLEMFDVKEGRSGDLDQVDLGRRGELLKGVRTAEEEFAVDRGAAKTGVDSIEVRVAGFELGGK